MVVSSHVVRVLLSPVAVWVCPRVDARCVCSGWRGAVLLTLAALWWGRGRAAHRKHRGARR